MKASHMVCSREISPAGWDRKEWVLMASDLKVGDVLLPQAERGTGWCLRIVRLEDNGRGDLRLTYQMGTVTPGGRWVARNGRRHRSATWVRACEWMAGDTIVLRRIDLMVAAAIRNYVTMATDALPMIVSRPKILHVRAGVTG